MSGMKRHRAGRSWSAGLLLSLLVLGPAAVPGRADEAGPRPPLVYASEHGGADHPDPPLPDLDELPLVPPLPDPFEWSDGSGRSTDFADWPRRRAEIHREIEHYEIGRKPGPPDELRAKFDDGVLEVSIEVGGESLVLRSKVALPEGDGPFPALIGIGSGTGSLPPELIVERRIARIAFDFQQVMSHTQKRGREPINRLYPELEHIGAYSAWSWGISRLIDGLEQLGDELPVDRSRLALSGCSFAGKMALFGGAFDERIALTIAQEPGGGGAAAWRVSETLGEVETLGRTSRAWFRESMFRFAGGNVARLPHDHHELMAMVAPRALLVLGNTDYQWLAEESGYVSCRAAARVWQAFGVPERFGFSIVGGHPHCQVPESQRAEVAAFLDRFLLGDESADTRVARHPFGEVDHERWTRWWGSGKPVLPEPSGGGPGPAE